jgi:hypothetical protein
MDFVTVPDFIQKKDIKGFTLEYSGGLWAIKVKGFKQLLKPSEYLAVIDACVPVAPVLPAQTAVSVTTEPAVGAEPVVSAYPVLPTEPKRKYKPRVQQPMEDEI